MKDLLILILIFFSCAGFCHAQSVHGRVVSQKDGTALVGASVKIKKSSSGTLTDVDGTFSLAAEGASPVLIISFIGFVTQEFVVSDQQPVLISMQEDANQLSELVVSTGYEQIPAERSTGSFATVDQKLLNRRVSTDILSRMEDLVPGLSFRKGKGTYTNAISIRGRSTIKGSTQPLIVVDNFPFEGDINSINPNDIENITILKDAAAASIWGARAGNGVIVITSKKGRVAKPSLSFNSNITFSAKPDLFYRSRMSSSEFIDVEKMLFQKGYYASSENSVAKAPLTPAVELMIAGRDGKITQQQLSSDLAGLSAQDVRNDFSKYFYRTAANQQYALNLSGGSQANRYFFSAGYDKNLAAEVRNGYDRVTLSANNTYQNESGRLEFVTGLYFASAVTANNNPGIAAIRFNPYTGIYPYARLADAGGNPLSTVNTYRQSFVDAAQDSGLLDWHYSPLQELNVSDNKTCTTHYRANAALKYKLSGALRAELYFQYAKDQSSAVNLQSQDSFYTRDLINNYTQVSAAGVLTRAVPLGAIKDLTSTSAANWNLRGQLHYNKTFGTKHELSALAGYEVRDNHTLSGSSRLYGYNPDYATVQPVDYITSFPAYYYPRLVRKIPFRDSESDLTDRFVSQYTNGAYTYAQQLTVSASARFDQSNLIGTSDKGVPLWSLGLAWNLHQQGFYHFSALPYLKVRATYGYSGNVNKSVTALTTAYAGGINAVSQLPYSTVVNPPNPDLRWERSRMINTGIDFESKGSIISGTVEFYWKKGMDLIGVTPFAPSTGITTFTGNTADTKGKGLDLTLNSKNIQRQIAWNTTLLLSYQTERVTHYPVQATATSYVQSADGIGVVPLEGKPVLAVYAYRWAGLDPATGNPWGYLNGDISTDYQKIIQTATPQNLDYKGPALPVVFGALRNTVSWKGLSLSANVSFRLGHYFRRESVRYADVLSGAGSHGDYRLRWQNPGDEKRTHVPSIPESSNANRDNFYAFSSALVEKADNIRLQDVSLSYELNKNWSPWLPFKKVNLYLYANNLGILWKATQTDLDPDYSTVGVTTVVTTYPPPRSLAIGLKIDI